MITVDIRSKKVCYLFNLYRKMTVIRGDSGVGKTTFAKAVASKTKFYTKKPSPESFVVLESSSWESVLRDKLRDNRSYIFIIDDSDFIRGRTFSTLYATDTKNYYIVINRFVPVKFKFESFSRVPFAVDSVYRFVAHGRNHSLEPYYSLETSWCSRYDVVVTEDEGAGYKFLCQYNSNVSTTRGKDNIIDFFNRNKSILRGKRIFLYVDQVSYGSCFDKLFYALRNNGIQVTIFYAYESFEQLLLTSRLLNYDFDSITNADIAKFASHEKLYEYIITHETMNKPYHYNAVTGKGDLSSCYTSDCCVVDRSKKQCDRGIAGSKLDNLFRGTAFEKLFNILRNSSLTKIEYIPGKSISGS